MSHHDITRLRTVFQMMEIKEFAALHRLDYRDNEVYFRWVDGGHAKLFDDHFQQAREDIVAHCQARCGSQCKGDPDKCPLASQLHQLMRDGKDW